MGSESFGGGSTGVATSPAPRSPPSPASPPPAPPHAPAPGYSRVRAISTSPTEMSAKARAWAMFSTLAPARGGGGGGVATSWVSRARLPGRSGTHTTRRVRRPSSTSPRSMTGRSCSHRCSRHTPPEPPPPPPGGGSSPPPGRPKGAGRRPPPPRSSPAPGRGGWPGRSPPPPTAPRRHVALDQGKGHVPDSLDGRSRLPGSGHSSTETISPASRERRAEGGSLRLHSDDPHPRASGSSPAVAIPPIDPSSPHRHHDGVHGRGPAPESPGRWSPAPPPPARRRTRG